MSNEVIFSFVGSYDNCLRMIRLLGGYELTQSYTYGSDCYDVFSHDNNRVWATIESLRSNRVSLAGIHKLEIMKEVTATRLPFDTVYEYSSKIDIFTKRVK